jgi:opacity protein-like surface antigen
MKILKYTLILSGLTLTQNIYAQKSPESLDGKTFSESLSFSLGIGSANYYGDLMKNSGVFKQTSAPSVSMGVQYKVNSFINCGINLGFQKLQGADHKSGGAHPGRNLDFKSSVFNFTAFGEFVFLPNSNIRPLISAGFGVMTFDPYTEDATGKKVRLRELGTEGQGLPGKKGLYGNSTWVAPLGVGVRYTINDNLGIALEYKYHFTGTDYLDDVSLNGYPDKAALDARNPLTSKFTYRGEGEYPINLALPRGNPDDKDGFYTFQAKFIFSL